MRKFKIFINLDKEETWLNEMAGSGYELISASNGFYAFRSGQPDQANIRIDYRVFTYRDSFEDYVALFEDSGWKHIAGTKRSGHQYFKRIAEDGGEDIFSDKDSKSSRYRRMSQMWLSLAASFFPILVALMMTGAIDASALLNPKDLYYTQGLWEKTGSDFWSAFLFETPFALFRGILWLLIPSAIVFYLVCSIKAGREYRKHL